jgi:hypothetical protein
LEAICKDPNMSFHERLVFAVIAGEVTDEIPIFTGSLKRLILGTGFPKNDVDYALARLMSEGYIEPVGSAGFLLRWAI